MGYLKIKKDKSSKMANFPKSRENIAKCVKKHLIGNTIVVAVRLKFYNVRNKKRKHHDPKKKNTERGRVGGNFSVLHYFTTLVVIVLLYTTLYYATRSIYYICYVQ